MNIIVLFSLVFKKITIKFGVVSLQLLANYLQLPVVLIETPLWGIHTEHGGAAPGDEVLGLTQVVLQHVALLATHLTRPRCDRRGVAQREGVVAQRLDGELPAPLGQVGRRRHDRERRWKSITRMF